MDKVTAGENISIVDLRQPIDIEAFPQMIPGAASYSSLGLVGGVHRQFQRRRVRRRLLRADRARCPRRRSEYRPESPGSSPADFASTPISPTASHFHVFAIAKT
jgi:hypothetical protein